MLEKNLEECLNNAFKFAHENNHEFVTTEHLLLCILNNQDALNVLLACDVNIDILEAELKEFISKNCPEKKDEAVEIQPTLSFQRVIQELFFMCSLLVLERYLGLMFWLHFLVKKKVTVFIY